MMMRHEGTRNPDNSKAPRIGDKEPPPVKRNLTDKEKLEMLFKYLEVLNYECPRFKDKRILQGEIARTLAEIGKILIDDRYEINLDDALRKKG